MSHLPAKALHAERLADLRGQAALRLAGAAANKGSGASAADALLVLHALASSPVTASDALTLLHELQVHQVELDLQAQELHESRNELEAALRRQIALYDRQPVGCFTIDARLNLHELNQSGADMLGIARDDAYGVPLDAFLHVDSVRRLRSALSGVDAGMQAPGWRLRLCPRDGPERSVLANIGADTEAGRYIVNLTPAADAEPGATELP